MSTQANTKMITTTADAQAEIQRQAELLARKMLAEQVVYEIYAPVYRMAEDDNNEKYTWEDAAKDGTFALQIPAYRVTHPYGKKDKKGQPLDYVLPTNPIFMVAGKGQTSNKAVAEWIKRHYGYEIVEVRPNEGIEIELTSGRDKEDEL